MKTPMKPERLEELRQMAGAVDGQKSQWMDELIEEIDRLQHCIKLYQAIPKTCASVAKGYDLDKLAAENLALTAERDQYKDERDSLLASPSSMARVFKGHPFTCGNCSIAIRTDLCPKCAVGVPTACGCMEDDEDKCGTRMPNDRFYCCLPKNHAGPKHICCGLVTHRVMEWPMDPPVPMCKVDPLVDLFPPQQEGRPS